jgi:protein-S-isoprenylcysteine O-methyltransferase Ste14
MKGGSMDLSFVVIVLSTIWLSSEIILARAKRAGGGPGGLDRSSLRVLWIAIAVSITGGVMLGMQRFGHIPGDPVPLQIAGMVLILCGIIIRWIAILSLKEHFTVDVAIGKDHRIVRKGLYGYIRHPAYAGSLMSFLGLGVYFANYLSLVVIFIPILAAFMYRIRVEEKALIDAFGEEYRGYQAETKRLVPGMY